MKAQRGIQIVAALAGSPAKRAGIRPGERLISIDGQPARDCIDCAFYGADEEVQLEIEDAAGRRRVRLIRKPFGANLGLDLEDFPVRRCGNKCVFCFVCQNPPGLRKELYVRDEDFRLSFLHGNYVTAVNLKPADIKRIAAQRLSPLYISVHTTNEDLRRRMLGAEHAPPILDVLRGLAEQRIQLHTQIVVCPGWNDGAELERTIADLAALGPRLLSIAVVPVGLTAHRQGLPALQPVTRTIARRVLAQGRRLQRRLSKELEEPVLFYADEWHLLAGEPWPDYRGVEALEQLENGVGMLWDFYGRGARWDTGIPSRIAAPRRIAVLTSPLGALALGPAVERLNRVANLRLEPIILENSLFGRPVTVSGLLPGRDFLRGIRENPRFDLYLVPANSLRSNDRIFLDDLALDDLAAATDGRVLAVAGGARDLARAALKV